MAWTELTVEHMRGKLSKTELDLLRTLDVEEGQADPLEEILSRTVAEARAHIPALRADPTAAAGLLPKSLHGAALDIARFRLATRLATGARAAGLLLSEPRQRAYTDALQYLRDVARGVIAVEPPPDGDPPAAPAPAHWGSAERFEP